MRKATAGSSAKYRAVKRWYESGVYTLDDVSIVVPKGISEEEFEMITSISYAEYMASKEEVEGTPEQLPVK